MKEILPSNDPGRGARPRRVPGLVLVATIAALSGCGGGESGGGGGGGGGGDLLLARSALTEYDFGSRTQKGLGLLAELVAGADAEGARALRSRVITDVLLYASARGDDKLLEVLGSSRPDALALGVSDGKGGGSSGAAFADLLEAWEGEAGEAVATVAEGKDIGAAARARILGILWCLEGFEAAVIGEPEEIEGNLARCGGYVAGSPRPWAGAPDRLRKDFGWLAKNAATSPVTQLWTDLEERFGNLMREHGARLPRAADLTGLTLPVSASVEALDIRTPYARITPERVYVEGDEIAETGSEGIYVLVAEPVIKIAAKLGEGTAPPPLTIYADSASTYFVVADLMLAAQTAGLDGTVLAATSTDEEDEGIRGVRLALPAPAGTDAPKHVSATLNAKGFAIKGKGGGKVPVVDGTLDADALRTAVAAAAKASPDAPVLELVVGPKVATSLLVLVADAATVPVDEEGGAPFGSVVVDPMEGRATGEEIDRPRGPTISEIDSRGTIDGSEVKRLVKSHLGTFRACYEKELKKDYKLRGRLAVRVVVNLDGSVRYVKIELDSIRNPRIRTCVLKRFQGLRFPKPEGGRATFIYPFDFEPTE